MVIDNNPLPPPPPRPTLARITEAALWGVIIVGAVVAAMGGIVYYVVSTVQDSLTLTILACVMGLAFVVAVALSIAGAVMFVRHMGSAIADKAAGNQQQTMTAVIALAGQMQQTNETMHRMMQHQQPTLPAPQQPAQLPSARSVFMDGTKQDGVQPVQTTVRLEDGSEARLDLVAALIDLGFDDVDDTVTDTRAAMREKFPEIAFRNASLTLAQVALIEWGALDDAGNWLVRHDEALRTLQRMKQQGIPSPTRQIIG